LPREKFLARSRAHQAIVVNSPMNPIGKVFDALELRFLADQMLAHDLVAISRRGL